MHYIINSLTFLYKHENRCSCSLYFLTPVPKPLDYSTSPLSGIPTSSPSKVVPTNVFVCLFVFLCLEHVVTQFGPSPSLGRRRRRRRTLIFLYAISLRNDDRRLVLYRESHTSRDSRERERERKVQRALSESFRDYIHFLY